MITDNERRLWVEHDGQLLVWYLAWRRSNRGGLRGFIRANRRAIDSYINVDLT